MGLYMDMFLDHTVQEHAPVQMSSVKKKEKLRLTGQKPHGHHGGLSDRSALSRVGL
jgi:hypothetical protein